MRISDWSSDVCSSDLDQIEDRQHADQEEDEAHPVEVGVGRTTGDEQPEQAEQSHARAEHPSRSVAHPSSPPLDGACPEPASSLALRSKPFDVDLNASALMMSYGNYIINLVLFSGRGQVSARSQLSFGRSRPTGA